MNPELRQTLQQFTRGLESANEAAQENIYTFTQLYIDPCIGGIKACVHDCTASCFPTREEQLRRRRGQSQGGAEFNFDFYDDWNQDQLEESGWGDDELDGLLAGRGASQPGRQRAMSYGARRRRDEAELDTNVIPKSSYLGFLERLPFGFGRSGVRYKPSAANLEENPGGLRIRDVESAEPLLSDNDEASYRKGHSRQRSGTQVSHSTITSRSSRGDLIMSDEEDDAVPLDDEFAVAMLSRRTTEDNLTAKVRRSFGASRISSRTVSSRSVDSQDSPRNSNKKLSKSTDSLPSKTQDTFTEIEPPTLVDLKDEEERLRQQEEFEILQKREAAQKLAHSMGLNTEVKSPNRSDKSERSDSNLFRSPVRQNTDPGYFAMSSPISPSGETEPFPNLETPRSPQSPLHMRDVGNGKPP